VTHEFLTRRELLGAIGVLAGGGGVGAGATRRGRAQSDERWPQFGQDRANTGHTAGNGPRAPVTDRWSHETGGGVSSSPAVVDGSVYIGSADGSVYALSVTDGAERWTYETGDSVVSSPTLVDGTVYVGSHDSAIYALSTADGSEQWSYRTGGEIWSSPAVADGTVYIGSRDGTLHAVSTTDGSTQWTHSTGGWVESPPAVADGTVYVGSLDGSVYALSVTDGSEQWVFTADGGIACSPAVGDGTVYIGSEDNGVYALSTADGTELWRFATGDRVFSSPAVVDGTVHIGGVDGSVYALSAADGSEQWSYRTGGPVFSSPAVVDGTVYIGSGDGSVFALADGGATPSPTRTEVAEVGDAVGSATPRNALAIEESSDSPFSTELLATLIGGAMVGSSGLWWLRGRRSADDDGDETRTAERTAETGPSASGEADTTTEGQDADSPDSATADPAAVELSPTVIDRHLPEAAPTVDPVSVDYDSLTGREELHSAGNGRLTRATLTTADGERSIVLKEPGGTETLYQPHIEDLLDGAAVWSEMDDHDHIVRVLDYAAEPLPWIAMEYMDGGPLAERVGALDLPQALWTSLAITKAVHHAHRHGVTHLGLTPRNVLFRETPAGVWDWPKVSDWGTSGILSPAAEGNPSPYAAPEQTDAVAAPTDDITDVYGAGAVCYELFTGRPPFETGPGGEERARTPKPPSTVADVPAALDDILLPALAWDRSDRYDSIVYLRDELGDRFLES
jgi:outer membrane protein assembly factor BamB